MSKFLEDLKSYYKISDITQSNQEIASAVFLLWIHIQFLNKYILKHFLIYNHKIILRQRSNNFKCRLIVSSDPNTATVNNKTFHTGQTITNTLDCSMSYGDIPGSLQTQAGTKVEP
jgi:hypothetical protein